MNYSLVYKGISTYDYIIQQRTRKEQNNNNNNNNNEAPTVRGLAPIAV